MSIFKKKKQPETAKERNEINNKALKERIANAAVSILTEGVKFEKEFTGPDK